jgi:hypothetical protein
MVRLAASLAMIRFATDLECSHLIFVYYPKGTSGHRLSRHPPGERVAPYPILDCWVRCGD